jgi:hypothetical protein
MALAVHTPSSDGVADTSSRPSTSGSATRRLSAAEGPVLVVSMTYSTGRPATILPPTSVLVVTRLDRAPMSSVTSLVLLVRSGSGVG